MKLRMLLCLMMLSIVPLVARDQTDIGTGFCQSERNGLANPAAGPGDDGDLVLQ